MVAIVLRIGSRANGKPSRTLVPAKAASMAARYLLTRTRHLARIRFTCPCRLVLAGLGRFFGALEEL